MIEAGELGEIRHFRGRYLQDWGDDATLDTWRFHPDEAGSGALGDLGTHVVDLARFLAGEIETVSGFAKTFVPGRTVDDAIEAAVEFDSGAIGTIEATRLALGRRNAFQWEINGSKGSLAFDMERLNELQVFRADGDRARGFKTVLVSEADHPFWEHWWPPGHIIGWGDTFVHELHHFAAGDRRRHGRGPVRRDVRGRLPRGRGLRRDRPLGRDRLTHPRRVPHAVNLRTSFDLRTCVRTSFEPGSSVCASPRARAWPCRRVGRTPPRSGRGDSQADDLLERVLPALPRAVERCDAGEPVLALRADAPEDDAVLEHRVDSEHRPVERHRLLCGRRCRSGRRRLLAAGARGCRPSAARRRPPRRPGRSCRARRAACRASRRTSRRTPRRPGSPARATPSRPRRLRAGAGSSSASRSRRRRSRARARAARAAGSRSRARAATHVRRPTSARPARRAGRATAARLISCVADSATDLAREAVEPGDPALDCSRR